MEQKIPECFSIEERLHLFVSTNGSVLHHAKVDHAHSHPVHADGHHPLVSAGIDEHTRGHFTLKKLSSYNTISGGQKGRRCLTSASRLSNFLL